MKKLVKKIDKKENSVAFFIGVDENTVNGVIGKCSTSNSGCNFVSGCS